MTICIAIKCFEDEDPDKETILFATDTQVSSPFLTTISLKCKPLLGPTPEDEEEDTWVMLFASSGDAFITDEVYEKIQYFLRENLEVHHKPSIGLSVLRSEIGDIAYKIYNKYKERGVSNSEFTLMLGAADDFSCILQVTHEGKTREIEDFGIIGSGQVTGGELLLREFLKEKCTATQAARLASLIISLVSQTDPFVGGKVDIRFCQDRITWYFPKVDEQIIDVSEARWQLLKKLWWSFENDSSKFEAVRSLLEDRV